MPSHPEGPISPERELSKLELEQKLDELFKKKLDLDQTVARLETELEQAQQDLGRIETDEALVRSELADLSLLSA